MLTLGQSVSVEGEFINMADASSGFDKTSQAVGNVAGLAAAFGLGGFGLGKTRKFEFIAKPGNYEQVQPGPQAWPTIAFLHNFRRCAEWSAPCDYA